MSEKTPVIVVSAHPDDWQIFAGAAISARLRNRSERVTIIMLTAGDAGDESYHWKARHCGALVSMLQAMPSWSPYDALEGGSNSGFSVAYETITRLGKTILRTIVRDASGSEAEMFSLHVCDGGVAGDGYAPRHQSLQRLQARASTLGSVWPSASDCEYASWSELQNVLVAVVREVIGDYDKSVPIYAPDPNPQRNPGDHADHVAAGVLTEGVCDAVPQLAPVWIAMYDIANRAENLEPAQMNAKRAAIYAYGAGYTAAASSERAEWRRGWEREYPVYGRREYLTEER